MCGSYFNYTPVVRPFFDVCYGSSEDFNDIIEDLASSLKSASLSSGSVFGRNRVSSESFLSTGAALFVVFLVII